jgi:hypothetical protein
MDSTGGIKDPSNLSKVFPLVFNEDSPEYDPVDPKESPMWVVVSSPVFYLE